MRGRLLCQLLLAGLLTLVLDGRAFAQARLYTAGQGSAVTSIPQGTEVCGTSTTSMTSIDGASYSAVNVSGFAPVTPQLWGSVPNPMGRDTTSATSGRWGASVVNPTRDRITVTRVEFVDVANAGLFKDVSAVQPLSGWSKVSSNIVWAGSLDVSPQSVLEFIVQIAPNRVNATNSPITLRATTSAGVLTRTDFVTSQRNNDDNPYVSLPFVVSGLELFSGVAGNGGAVETGRSQVFRVRVKDSEEGNDQPIPSGTQLSIIVPPGFSNVTANSGQPGFSATLVTQPSACAQGSVVVLTTMPILDSSQTFQFSATAPSQQGGIGLYPFTARLENPNLTPAINTRTEFTQQVTLAPSTGVRAGLTAVEALVSVPNPMGSNKFSTWGVAVANPQDTPLTVTSVRIQMANPNDQFFKAVTPMRPATGWVRTSTTVVEWTGSVRIGAHDAENFLVQIQANGKNGVDRALTVSVNGSIVKSATTTQSTGNPPAVSLYYMASGAPSVYTYGVVSGQPRSFQVAIRETQSVNINAGAELKIVIPAGWSAASAATQAGFGAPTIVQPSPTVPGEIRATLSTPFKDGTRNFAFTATAPSNLLTSLFAFPTTLTSSQVRSSCEMVAQVVDASGGLQVEHLSPPIGETDLNQVDFHFVTRATPDTGFTASVYNFATSSWVPLGTATLGAAPTTQLGSITTSLEDYFDAPLTSSSKHLRVRLNSSQIDNHFLDEDYVAFIVSEYSVAPRSVAPSTTFRGALRVPMQALRFETQAGLVDLYTLKVIGRGTDPLSDIALVRLFHDLNCDGVIDAGEPEPLPGMPLQPDATLVFGTAPTPLLTFSASSPVCAIVAYDIDAAAGAFNTVSVEIANGFDLRSSVGALYPFPSIGGYPIVSGDALIPGGPPSLSIDKSVGPPLAPPATHYRVGSTVTYTIDVTNLGESPATSVSVFDTLDPAWAPYTGVVTPLDGGSLCLPPSCPTARVTWPVLPTLAANASQTATYRFSVVIPKNIPDQSLVPNVARGVSNEEPAGVDSNDATLPVCAPVLQASKALPATPADYAVGELIEWTIDVTNTGSCDASGLMISDIIDVSLLLESSLTFTPASGTWNPVTKTYTWSEPVLASGAAMQYKVAGRIQAQAQGSVLCNSASLMWEQATSSLTTAPPGGACTSTPILSSRCLAGNLPASADLRVVKTPAGDMIFSWGSVPGSTEEHLNRVPTKTELPMSRRGPVGVGAAMCDGTVSGCTLTGAATALPALGYYESFGACGPLGSDEGAR